MIKTNSSLYCFNSFQIPKTLGCQVSALSSQQPGTPVSLWATLAASRRVQDCPGDHHVAQVRAPCHTRPCVVTGRGWLAPFPQAAGWPLCQLGMLGTQAGICLLGDLPWERCPRPAGPVCTCPCNAHVTHNMELGGFPQASNKCDLSIMFTIFKKLVHNFLKFE